MKCKEVRAVTKLRGALEPSVAIEVATHAETCQACRNLLLLDRLAPAIIRAAGASRRRAAQSISNAALVSRVRTRVRQLREQHSNSWETAVESTRGWLAAFAATAVVLIAASVQWQPSAITSDFDHDGEEIMAQNPAEYLIGDAPDPIGPTTGGKDNPYADK